MTYPYPPANGMYRELCYAILGVLLLVRVV